ncbi:MAG: hypothetical protein EOR55_35035, partial [Mesorhizobium sp.]
SPMQSVHPVTYLSGSDTGHFSPYNDGEKGSGRNFGALSATMEIGEILCEGVLLPVTIRGEVPGRAMRGSANLRRSPCRRSIGRRLGELSTTAVADDVRNDLLAVPEPSHRCDLTLPRRDLLSNVGMSRGGERCSHLSTAFGASR